MYKIVKGDWFAAKEQHFDLPERGRVNIKVSSIQDVAVCVQPQEGEWITVKTGSDFSFIADVIGFERLRLTGKSRFGASVLINGVQIEEPHTKEKMIAPPMPENEKNLLQRIKDSVANEMKRMRDPVLERDLDMTISELDEDMPDEFEEEIAARLKQEQEIVEKEAEEATSPPNNGASTDEEASSDDK